MNKDILKRIGKMNNQEYLDWLQKSLLDITTMPLLSDLYYLRDKIKEARRDAYLHNIHCNGLCPECMKKHQSSKDR